jgi:hypothetical protein
MASQTENLTATQPEARKENVRKSTGPRTVEGKRRSSQNARKHGLYSNAHFFWDAAIALGEDPRDFERLLKGLVLARQPADTLEMVLVEDIALLVWKKARLDRAEAAVQVCNLQKHDLDRRKQFVQVGRDISDTLQSEVRAKGLRTTLDAPGKFEQILSILDILVEMVEKNDFSSNMQEFLRSVYGQEPTLRGAGLYNNYFKLSEMQAGSQEFEDAKTLMRARLAEEISDVAQQYELFLHEHVENTRAARMAATAPSHAQWAAIIRQQNALHRQLQQKIRLLAEIQEKRKREEERFLDNCETSLRRNPPDAPRGGRHGANLTRSAGPASPGPASRPPACGVGYPQNETTRGGRQASNRKKILNRGNEPKTLLKTDELADTAPSKRTPFCPGKSAIKAKKRDISMQETAGTGDSSAAGGDVLLTEGEAGAHLARWRKVSRVMERAHRAPCVLEGDGVGMLRSFGSPRWTDWFSGRAGLSVLPRSAQNDFLAMFLHGVRGIARVNDQARVPHNGRIIICRMVRGNDYHVVFCQGFRCEFHAFEAEIVFSHFRETRKVRVVVVDAGSSGLKQFHDFQTG